MPKVSEREILEIIQDTLELEGKVLAIDSSMEDLEEWDSIGHLSILTNLDKVFEGKAAEIQELATADSVQKILQVLRDNALID